MDQMEAEDGEREPSPRIRAYVDDLLARWPDITEGEENDSPWADGPLLGNAWGDAIYFSVVWSRCEEAAEFAANLAQQHDLVCYDPQSEQLLPDLGGERRARRGWFARRR
ncbi:hypothetical protein [Isoptericola sp. NPDC057191]|uniref:hypothetical protein n=1 Tax=Isoptericola sp. NPDC057191 TaxID=3346041 RepID=UPI00362A9D57